MHQKFHKYIENFVILFNLTEKLEWKWFIIPSYRTKVINLKANIGEHKNQLKSPTIFAPPKHSNRVP